MEPKEYSDRLEPLIQLVHRRWNIPIIGELYRQSGAKFVTLANVLGAGRASLSDSLYDLVELGLVFRNPGHGHPMRPEYVLTDEGMTIGKECLALKSTFERSNEQNIAFRKWTLPLVAAIGDDVLRFRDVQLMLPGATPRAITLGLKTMLSRRWVRRSLVDEFPPAAGYSLLSKGRRVLGRVEALF